MSRIRSIKPEIWTSSDFLALSTAGQLAFIWLMSNADDEGRLKTNAGHIERVLGVSDIADQLAVMERHNMIRCYEVAAHGYVEVCAFGAHQRIDKPQPSRLPAFPNTKRSKSVRGLIAERSENDPRTFPPRARPGSIDQIDQKDLVNPPTPKGELLADQVFEDWKQVTGRNGGTLFTADRRKNVLARIRDGYTLEDFRLANRGVMLSPHNQGQNDRGRKFDDLELICRSGSKLEGFRDLALRGPVPTNVIDRQTMRLMGGAAQPTLAAGENPDDEDEA